MESCLCLPICLFFQSDSVKRLWLREMWQVGTWLDKNRNFVIVWSYAEWDEALRSFPRIESLLMKGNGSKTTAKLFLSAQGLGIRRYAPLRESFHPAIFCRHSLARRYSKLRMKLITLCLPCRRNQFPYSLLERQFLKINFSFSTTASLLKRNLYGAKWALKRSRWELNLILCQFRQLERWENMIWFTSTHSLSRWKIYHPSPLLSPYENFIASVMKQWNCCCCCRRRWIKLINFILLRAIWECNWELSRDDWLDGKRDNRN